MKVNPRWVTAGLLLLLMLAGLRYWQVLRRESSQDKPIMAAALRYRVDPALVKAVVWRESNFDPLAKGSKGEIGLMQIMEPTANEWAAAEKKLFFYHQQLFDPWKNTEAGAWYLKKLLGRYTQTDNPMAYALADYNAGRGNVLRWVKDPVASTNSAAFINGITYPSTREYVKSVLSRYEKYRGTLPVEKPGQSSK